MLRHLPRTAVLLQLFSVACASAQSPGAQQAAIREHRIELTGTVALPGLPNSGVLGYPATCSSDGDLYLGELVLKDGAVVSAIPDLFEVSATADVRRIPMPVPTDFKSADSPGFFAGEGVLVAVVSASHPADEQAAQAHPGATYFLSVTDSAGGHPRLIRLDLSFDVTKAAAFDSGGFVVLGMDRRSFRPVAAMLGADGQFKSYLDLFPKPGDAAAGDETNPAAEKARRRAAILSIGEMQLAPWGSDVLMAAPGIDNSSIYHIRASGQVEKVSINLPNGEQLQGILGSGGKDDWVVRTMSAESAKTMSEAHIVENPQESLYEVNPRSGEILGRLTVVGPQPGEVACAANGKLSAIYVGEPQQSGAPDKLVLASAPR